MILYLNDPLGVEVRTRSYRTAGRNEARLTHRTKQIEPTGTKKASADNTGLSVFAKTLPQVFTLFILCLKPRRRSIEHE